MFKMAQFRTINPLYILIGIIVAILAIFGIVELREYYEQHQQEENIAAGIRQFLEE